MYTISNVQNQTKEDCEQTPFVIVPQRNTLAFLMKTKTFTENYAAHIMILFAMVSKEGIEKRIRKKPRGRQKWLNQKSNKTVVIKKETKDRYTTYNTTLKT